MKKIIYTLFAVSVVLGTISCNEDNIVTPPEDGNKTGQLDLSSINIVCDESASVVRSVDIGNFIITICDENNVVSHEWNYREMPEIVTMEAGSYSMKIESHKQLNAAWDAPYYSADKNFVVAVDKVTAIGDVLCKMKNVKVTIEYSEDLLAVMGNDCKVNVALGRGTLDFAMGEKRAGYFAVDGDGSNRLYAHFSGSVDGYVDTVYREIENVKAGEWRILRYSLKQDDEPYVASGSFQASLSVDVQCSIVEQNVVIDVTEDVIVDPETGEEGNGEGSDDDSGTTPDVPTPPSSGPEITASAFDITEPQVITDDLEIKVEIRSELPIKGVTVDIESTTLTPSELEAVGLAAHLDLAYPGELRSLLEGLGFPVAENVVGQHELTFDITQFGGLLGALGAGTHKFVMTVEDEAANVTVQALTLITQ